MRPVAGICLAAVLLSARTGWSQDPDPAVEDLDDPPAAVGEAEPGPPADPEVAPKEIVPSDPEDDAPEAPLVPPARDDLGGHFVVGASALWAIPFGKLEAGASATDAMGSGPGVGLDVGYGVSRTVVVGAWGQALFLGSSDDCPSCSTSSMAFGAQLRYHLVQGMRFDPWMSAGLGYRLTTIDTPAGKVDYAGVEWLRLQVGGDWYAFQNLGFGPYAELDLGRYSSRSPGSLGSAENHWHFALGARVVFDTPGK